MMEKSTSKDVFRFLDLPAELRDKIYQYLLSTKYTKVELTYHEESPEVSLFSKGCCNSSSVVSDSG